MGSPLMNGATSVLFLDKLVAAYPNQLLLLLWDWAPWHHGPAIRNFLAAHPPASPDLNPQDHVWKAVREQVSHNQTVNKLDNLASVLKMI